MTTVRKTESSLKRLKGRKDGGGKDGKGDGKAAGAASDTDKICHQLLLDVQEYCRQVRAWRRSRECPAEVPIKGRRREGAAGTDCAGISHGERSSRELRGGWAEWVREGNDEVVEGGCSRDCAGTSRGEVGE